MPEAVLEQQPGTDSLGWRAGLPDDLKQNEAFKDFKTVGDLGKDYLGVKTKATDLEGKLAGSVPKLKDDATDAERNQYYEALGRPKTPSEYKLPGEDKNASEWNEWSHGLLHKAGLTAAQAEVIGAGWNEQMQRLVEANNVRIQNEVKASETALRSEWGDKYDTNVELAKRLYQKHLGKEFDKDFDAGTAQTRLSTIRLIVKFAALTGEDRSPQAGTSQSSGAKAGYDLSKFNLPPAKT